MKNERLLLLILAIVQFSHIIDFMMIMPLGSQLMRVFDISPQQFSFIVTSYALAAAAVSIVSAMFIDRFDRKQVLFWSYIGFTIGTWACAFSTSYYMLLAARSLTGVFGGLLSGIVLSIVGDVIPIERRGAAMGLIMTAFAVASVLGVPAGLFLASIYDWSMPFMIVAGIGTLFIFVIHYGMPPIRKHLEDGVPPVQSFRVIINIFKNANQRKALWFSLIMMLGHFTIIPFIAPYMTANIGFSELEISYIYLIGGLCTMVALPIFGRLSDKHGHQKVFMIMCTLTLIPIFMITNLSDVGIPIALVVTSSFFITASGRSVPATTMITAVVTAKNRGSFMSVRNSVNEFSLGLSSFIAGAIIVENPTTGHLENYNLVGYLAMILSLYAVWVGSKLLLVKEEDTPENTDSLNTIIHDDEVLDIEMMDK